MSKFWDKVDKSGECWIWLGARTEAGYGIATVDGVRQMAHRVALAKKLGRPIKDGMFACHRCDNPPCVRGSHLFEGSPQENALDAINKGRMTPPDGRVHAFRPGNTPHNEGMSLDEAARLRRMIRNRGLTTLAQFAQRHGLPLHVVKDLSSGRTYSQRLAAAA